MPNLNLELQEYFEKCFNKFVKVIEIKNYSQVRYKVMEKNKRCVISISLYSREDQAYYIFDIRVPYNLANCAFEMRKIDNSITFSGYTYGELKNIKFETAIKLIMTFIHNEVPSLEKYIEYNTN